jgi:hypothetical protein
MGFFDDFIKVANTAGGIAKTVGAFIPGVGQTVSKIGGYVQQGSQIGGQIKNSIYGTPGQGNQIYQGMPDVSGSYPVVFEHNDFGGQQYEIQSDIPDCRAYGIENDSISSVFIPLGSSITLYEHENFKGSSFTIDETTMSLPSFNDSASSIKLNRIGSQTKSNSISSTSNQVPLTSNSISSNSQPYQQGWNSGNTLPNVTITAPTPEKKIAGMPLNIVYILGAVLGFILLKKTKVIK